MFLISIFLKMGNRERSKPPMPLNRVCRWRGGYLSKTSVEVRSQLWSCNVFEGRDRLLRTETLEFPPPRGGGGGYIGRGLAFFIENKLMDCPDEFLVVAPWWSPCAEEGIPIYYP